MSQFHLTMDAEMIIRRAEPNNSFIAAANIDTGEIQVLPLVPRAPAGTHYPLGSGHHPVLTPIQPQGSQTSHQQLVDRASMQAPRCVGFTVIARSGATIDYVWNSGTLNSQHNPDGSREVPQRYRGPIQQAFQRQIIGGPTPMDIG